MRFAVIMAGGTGKRLWPLSREKRPKQVLKLLEGQTLLRKCFNRLTPLFDTMNILVLTNAGYSDMVRADLPELPYDNVISEPVVRDTAGAIGLAASVLTGFDPEATMAVVTADQVIKPADIFRQALSDGLTFVERNPQALITFGIQPTFASTQLGYIKLGRGEKCPDCDNEIRPVQEFREKPDAETAAEYIENGNYFWNSGLFVWKAKRILELIFENIPEARDPLTEIRSSWGSTLQEEILAEHFVRLPKISIDFAVMEKAQNVHAIRLDCKWFDMGSFSALADVIKSDRNGNIVVAGLSEVLDCKNSVIITEDDHHLITTIGLEKMVVVHTPDATLVCPMEQAQRLKELLELIKAHGRKEFL